MNASSPKLYGIKDAAEFLGLSVCWVRRAVLAGKIPSEKVEIAKNTLKHMITEEALVEWRKSLSGRSKRSDGRGKYVLYATPEEHESIQKLIEEGGIEALIQRANKVKKTE
jgi:hypothetical protein